MASSLAFKIFLKMDISNYNALNWLIQSNRKGLRSFSLEKNQNSPSL